ncbi:MAG TPA: iron-containing alcohol dehydrogenase family protein [Clostridiaceae bacterium]
MKKEAHKISIPSILEVGSGNINNVGYFISKGNFKKVSLYFGEGINELLGNEIVTSLKEVGIEIENLDTIVDIDFDSVANRAFSISNQVEELIGIGGGKVIDVVKYMSFLRKLPFISIPTSTSNDGFSSANASLLLDGKRLSFPSKTPFGIIVDIEVLKGAPDKFIYSGIGDLVSNITALYDWKFEEENGRTVTDAFAVMISKKAVNSFVRTEFKGIKEDFFLKELVDSLILNGIAMEIAQDSAPASGSEHLISHALDHILKEPFLHGIQVGLGTYVMSHVQDHRFNRVYDVLSKTGFFTYTKTLNLKREDFRRAIELAPSMKPNRYTYIHLQENIDKAIRFIYEDEVLKEVLK